MSVLVVILVEFDNHYKSLPRRLFKYLNVQQAAMDNLSYADIGGFNYDDENPLYQMAYFEGFMRAHQDEVIFKSFERHL